MTVQHRLLIAGLTMLVSLGLQWPIAAAVCELPTLVQAVLLLNLAALVVLLGSTRLRADWAASLPRWMRLQPHTP
jgi:anti-sigma factor RsiW